MASVILQLNDHCNNGVIKFDGPCSFDDEEENHVHFHMRSRTYHNFGGKHRKSISISGRAKHAALPIY